ncbi:MAG: RNA-binding S4 domain-containing protein [Candidatus Omnitrophica bacterium]|nr:RNA-binding S4 domain-containing protein [Candidatus Omnitrophota bacterium]MDD4013201.1 RNA-binding S4 domain-containing protein [Candidatus Omnitrophota bacterium]
MMEQVKVRIDKWLWAVRIFKTRDVSAVMCERGNVTIGGQNVKPSRVVAAGMEISVRKDNIDRVLEVLKVIDRRVSAKEAALCVRDMTPPEEIEKARIIRSMNAARPFREKGLGRPTKKERRKMDMYRGG